MTRRRLERLAAALVVLILVVCLGFALLALVDGDGSSAIAWAIGALAVVLVTLAVTGDRV